MSEYQGTFKRYEKKYLVAQQQYNALAKAFAARMVPDRFAESTISNIYYDTPDFRLIRRSLDRPAYKEKLRLRTYRTPGADTEAFVEIKKKYDHIVYKRRIAMTYSEAQAYLDGGAAPEQSQISREIDWFLHFYKGIQPAMCICYDRLALFDQYQPELRVTFDSGHSVAHGRPRPVLRLGRRAVAAARHLPDGDKDPRHNAPVAGAGAERERHFPDSLFQIRRGVPDHAARGPFAAVRQRNHSHQRKRRNLLCLRQFSVRF